MMPTAYIVTREWVNSSESQNPQKRVPAAEVSIIVCETCCVLHVPSGARVILYRDGCGIKSLLFPPMLRCARCGCEVEK